MTSAKNLGILIDETLLLDLQINRVAKNCYNVIRKLSGIRTFLDKVQLHTLVCSHILNRLDYCNTLYYGLSVDSIQKLQRAQNSAIRLVEKGTASFRQSLKPLYLQLHWLHIRERIRYNIIVLVHNCLQNNGPNELRGMLCYSDSVRTMDLKEPRIHLKYGKRAFSHAGPKLWNLLPMEIKTEHNTERFKKRLKSFLLIDGGAYNELIMQR